MMSKNGKSRIVIWGMFFIILIVGIMIVYSQVNSTNVKNESYITKGENKATIDLSKVKKITVYYLEEQKNLSDTQREEFIKALQDFEYSIIKEELLMVSTDYKVELDNGIYFTFGQLGTEVAIYENDKRKFTTTIPHHILNLVRKVFYQEEQKDNENATILQENQLTV